MHTPGGAAGKVGANHPLLHIDPELVSARSGWAGDVTGGRKHPLHLASAVASRLQGRRRGAFDDGLQKLGAP